ncbi:MAG: DUF3846 domain-containing protein [Oscillospiraceae bacterium]
MASEMMKVVMVEPNKPAYITEIEHSLKGMKEAVGGLIEPIYYLDEPRAVMVGNEEAKLIGLQGNRRFGDRIVAGPFFICGDNGEDFCSLSDELCEKYVQKFAVPESISQDEVEQDMGITLIGL